MMICAIFASILIPTPPAQLDSSWVRQALGTRIALETHKVRNRGSQAHRVASKYQGFLSPGGVASADPYPDQTNGRQWRDINRRLSMIGYTELTGDLKSALRSVEIFNRAYPQLEIATNEQRVMLEYLLGRHDNAYPDAVIAVEAAGAAGGEKPLLQLALTSASKGWVFPGQLDYCVRMLRESLGDRFPQRLIDLPKWDARKPRDVEEAACLALGAQNRQVSWAFLQRAHIINPSDSLAMRILVQVYEFDGQFSAARAAAREALRRSVDDEARRWFERELLNDASLPDRPYPRPSSGASDSR